MLFSFFLTKVYLIYKIMSTSGMQQKFCFTYICLYILFQILFHSRLLQDVVYCAIQ